ncbi:MAG TPA: hypothetical protein VN721_06240 [Flavipsychrobacter sp.]|nr:hypothetical protein [Flavipsychrobacter sp.]
MFKKLLTVLIISLVFIACKKHVKTGKPHADGNYWSIKQFAQDQFNTFHNQPFTLQRIITVNGKSDTSYVSAFEMDWGYILKIFFESDISDQKYLDHYSFETFDDNITQSRTFYYQAIDDNLFTRKLQILVDPVNNRIHNIYIETSKHTRWGERDEKLYYSPVKEIQIQIYEKSFMSDPKDSLIEYRFM